MNKENLQSLLCEPHLKNAKAHYDKLMTGMLEEDKRLVMGGCILTYILDRPFEDQLPAAADIYGLIQSAFKQCIIEQRRSKAVVVTQANCEESDNG